jgi:hypothetical protein
MVCLCAEYPGLFWHCVVATYVCLCTHPTYCLLFVPCRGFKSCFGLLPDMAPATSMVLVLVPKDCNCFPFFSLGGQATCKMFSV